MYKRQVEIVSKAEFATRLNVSKARVSQYVTRGLPVRDDGWLDLDAALAWVKDNGQLQSRFPDRGVRKVAKETVTSSRRREVSKSKGHRRRMDSPAGQVADFLTPA